MSKAMNRWYKIVVITLLAMVAVLSLAAVCLFPYKLLSSFLLTVSIFGLIIYSLFSNNPLSSYEKCVDVVIADELDRFFQKNKPYLNPDYKASQLEKQLKVTRGAISLFCKKRYGISFNQFMNLWRIAETKRLQSLPENKNVPLSKLCLEAGFSNAQQYHQAEKERKARKSRKNKTKPVIAKPEKDVIVEDPDVKKKPGIQMRV